MANVEAFEAVSNHFGSLIEVATSMLSDTWVVGTSTVG
jgi:hypothetical protein